MRNFIIKYGLYLAWLISLVAMGGSLFFSEVLKFPPCVLCWYQRIGLYPLVVIIAVGILRRDTKIYQYVLPLSVITMIVGIYHNLLYYNIIPESVAPCTAGVSCTTRFIEWFGFVTIPLMALTASTLITVIMFLYRHYVRREANIN